ncbi:MAG: hypothetical protein ACREP9_05170 [Candidatus Dormibacteraceae bacterium]
MDRDSAARAKAAHQGLLGGARLRDEQRVSLRELPEHDTLVVVAPAAGKTAIYAIGGELLGGPTVVVSPTLSLQRDQAESIADGLGLSGVLFGATVLAAATSLPEISTGLASVRCGDYQLAVSDIFGGNAFLPVLFLLATLISGQSVLPHAHDTDIYLTALGALLTLVYLSGLLFRPARRIGRMGIDSLAVLALYLAGVAGLIAIVTA